MFTNERVGVFADIHLGVHQGNNMWHETSINFAKWAKEQLNKNSVKDIIICGDTLNDRSEINVSTLHIMNQFFSILREFNIHIIVGNHDAYYKDRSDVNSLSLLSGWKNIEIVHEYKTLNQFDKNIGFCPWATPMDKIEKSDILFGHFDINGFYMNKAKISSEGISTSDILQKAPMVVTGHFHSKDERKYSNGTILYVGSPYELNWGEYGEQKGIFIVDLMKSEYSFIENNISPKHKRIKLSELIAAGKITESLKTDFNNNIVNFLIDRDIQQEKLDELVTRLSTLNPLILKTEYKMDSKEGDVINYDFTGVDIPTAISEFINILEIQNKEEVLKATLEIYKSIS